MVPFFHSLSGRKNDGFKENASRTTPNASLLFGKKEKSEGRNGRETETKFKSSRRSVQEVYAVGVVTLETHSNVTYDYY
jgi:hypothetical protein